MKTKHRTGRIPLFFAAACASLLAAAGCATAPAVSGEDSEEHASKVIAEKVAEASKAQAEYAALLAEKQQQTLRRQARLETDVIDVDWIGSPNEFLSMMADRYAYRYVEAGRRATLRTVNVRSRKMPAIEVLRDVALQINRTADLQLDMDAKIIRLIYKAD